MSGGLDSTIAAKMLLEQGIEVIGVYFYTGFCITAQKAKTGRIKEKRSDALKVAEELNIPLETIDISREYLPMVTNPQYGYGKNINPCIDCRIFMLKKAKEMLSFYDADFVATGEILGQRPKSQKKDTQRLIQKASNLGDKLLRPLSAQFLPETEAEREGWVKRENLGRMQGRSRKEQIKLAEKWNITKAATPAGGCCFLADETYSVRFKSLLQDKTQLLDKGEKERDITHDDVILLGTGRHFKILPGTYFICGRDEGENNLLSNFYRERILLTADNEIPAPTGMLYSLRMNHDIAPREKILRSEELQKKWNLKNLPQIDIIQQFIQDNSIEILPEEIALSAMILARYSDVKENLPVIISYSGKDMKSPENIVISASSVDDENILRQNMIIKDNL